MGYGHFRYARKIDGDTIGLYHNDMTKLLQIDKATANTTQITGQGVTGDNLKFKANTIDALPWFRIDGNAGILFSVPNNQTVVFTEDTDWFFAFHEAGGDSTVSTYGNKNIFLNPHGTGKVKFGTQSAHGDVVCDGDIPIIDAGGNARKLMTTA